MSESSESIVAESLRVHEEVLNDDDAIASACVEPSCEFSAEEQHHGAQEQVAAFQFEDLQDVSAEILLQRALQGGSVSAGGETTARGPEDRDPGDDSDDDSADTADMVAEDSDPELQEGEEEEEYARSDWETSSREDEDPNAHDKADTGTLRNEPKIPKGWEANEEDDEDAVPPRTKNEVTDLEPLEAELPAAPEGESLQVAGRVQAVMAGNHTLVVQAVERQAVLQEDTVLYERESRRAVGRLVEIFGPVANPLYVVQYNPNHLPEGLIPGSEVTFIDKEAQFVKPDTLYCKGYDASGAHDEEVESDNEYSDDEKERDAKQRVKQTKRKGGHDTDVNATENGQTGMKSGFLNGSGGNKGRGGRGNNSASQTSHQSPKATLYQHQPQHMGMAGMSAQHTGMGMTGRMPQHTGLGMGMGMMPQHMAMGMGMGMGMGVGMMGAAEQHQMMQHQMMQQQMIMQQHVIAMQQQQAVMGMGMGYGMMQPGMAHDQNLHMQRDHSGKGGSAGQQFPQQ